MCWRPEKGGRRFFLIAAGILLAAAVFWGWRYLRPMGAWAQITYDGQPVRIVSLNQDGEFALEQDPTVRFQVRGGAISFVDATCPDKICQRTGFLSRVGETAACLPRKTVVTVIAAPKGEELDAVAG